MPEPAFRWHFAGLTQLNASTNAAKLRQVLALPASGRLRDELVARCAGPLAELAMLGPAGGAAPGAAMQALLPELLQNESLIEVRVAGAMVKEWLVAVQLADVPAANWEAKYKELLAHAGTEAPTKLTYQSAFTGWQAGRKDRSGLYTYMRVGQWSVFNFQRDGRPWLAVMAQLKATGRPLPVADYLLALDLDMPVLKKWWPQAEYIDFPKVALTVAGQGDSLRTQARLRFPEAVRWTWQPWRIPTNSLQDPLLSFTAVQGIEPWLRRHPVIQKLELPFALDQFFVWAHNDVPFKSLLAMPLPDATNQLRRVLPRLQSTLNADVTPQFAGAVRVATNGVDAVWLGLPIFAPFIGPAASEPGGNFLLAGTMAGLVPTLPNTNPPPPELLSRVTSQTNLVYYDWEITEGRLAQWRQMEAIMGMLAPVPALPGTNAVQGWLEAVTPLLGNTITEATIAGPHELLAVRKSHLGLTGWELVRLAGWFNSANFPALGGAVPPKQIPLPGFPDLPVLTNPNPPKK